MNNSKNTINLSIFVVLKFTLLFTDFTLVAEERECATIDYEKGKVADITDCYNACENKASMFIFGRSGSSECDADGSCSCFCETTANDEGTCTHAYNGAYNLYRINVRTPSKVPSVFIERIKYNLSPISGCIYLQSNLK